MHRRDTVSAFTEMAESFNAAAVTRMPETLDRLLETAQPGRDERWLDAACGPGVVSRALAPLVGEVVGVDLTPAMLDVARREAAAAGLRNARFAAGDLMELDLPDAAFDGAVCRFALHHVPVPSRAVAELRRVVRPGGAVVLADHVGDDDADALAWSQAVERLRDPSHWCSLTQRGLRRLGETAGLRLEEEHVGPVGLDFADWLARGPGTAEARRQIDWALAARPEQSARFHTDGRTLVLHIWTGRWRRP